MQSNLNFGFKPPTPRVPPLSKILVMRLLKVKVFNSAPYLQVMNSVATITVIAPLLCTSLLWISQSDRKILWF